MNGFWHRELLKRKKIHWAFVSQQNWLKCPQKLGVIIFRLPNWKEQIFGKSFVSQKLKMSISEVHTKFVGTEGIKPFLPKDISPL